MVRFESLVRFRAVGLCSHYLVHDNLAYIWIHHPNKSRDMECSNDVVDCYSREFRNCSLPLGSFHREYGVTLKYLSEAPHKASPWETA